MAIEIGQTLVSSYFAFTITLKPLCYRYTAEQQYDLTAIPLCKKLREISSKFTLISELTSYGFNVHYHGIIQFIIKDKKDLKKKFVDHFRQDKDTYGFVTIKLIDNEPKWQEYITKDLVKTLNEISRPPIIRDDFNIMPYTFENYKFFNFDGAEQ